MGVTVHIKSWNQTRSLVESMPGCIFRGQADAMWPLSTRLEREAAMTGCAGKHIANRESHILRQFMRRAHRFVATPPADVDLLEWLALMQHHGGPTRLLDFTHSFYVAAFFAVEAASGDAAVWAYNKMGRFLRVEDDLDGFGDLLIDDVNKALVARASRCVAGEESAIGVIPVEPERLSERLAAQQGTFLCPLDVARPFMENVAYSLGISHDASVHSKAVAPHELSRLLLSTSEADLVKVILPRSIHADALTDLWGMNISSATLFPGLDGFARSLSYHMRITELVPPDRHRP